MDRRGQSSVMGIVLLVGITVVGVTAILAFGTMALDDARADSQTTSVEHAMTQFDSRAAMVALGKTDTQSVSFPAANGGTFEVRPNEGWVSISHVNYTADPSRDVETLLNTSLGNVVYDKGDTEIAYQAGGVWKTDGEGSVMISPPEVHYRGSTLTFPVITVDGDGSVAGSASAGIDSTGGSVRHFPNGSETYSSGSKRYLNPIEKGNVTVTIRSQFYDAWASYFRTRTAGSVEEFDNNETVRVTLVSFRLMGDFNMPSEGNAMEIRGLEDGHQVNDFSLTLEADNTGNNFNNMHWSLYEESGNKKFEVHFYSSGKCNGGSYGNGDLDVSVFYYDGNNEYHEWQNESIDPATSSAFDVDCSDYTIEANLVTSTALEYDDISLTGGNNKWYFGSTIDNEPVSDPIAFDAHSIDGDAPRNGKYNASSGETEELGFLINHYLGVLGPSTDLTVTDGPGGSSRIDEGASTGSIDYDTAGGQGFLTFLHISENRINVSVD